VVGPFVTRDGAHLVTASRRLTVPTTGVGGNEPSKFSPGAVPTSKAVAEAGHGLRQGATSDSAGSSTAWPLSRRCFTSSKTTGSSEMAMIPKIASSKFSLTTGMLPNR
jgi:hypothetical protein